MKIGRDWRLIKKFRVLDMLISALLLVLLLTACTPFAKPLQPQGTVTINPGFQKQLSPVPTVPPYRCGAWADNNVPGAYSTLTVYAKLTSDVTGVPGINAQAVVHFQSGDVTLDQKPTSDSGGYVTFTVPLAGRQPIMVPTTVEVIFHVPNAPSTVHCSAFFTPQ